MSGRLVCGNVAALRVRAVHERPPDVAFVVVHTIRAFRGRGGRDPAAGRRSILASPTFTFQRPIRGSLSLTLGAPQRPGSTSSRIRPSASRPPPKAAAIHGPPTAAKTNSRPGQTILSATPRARLSMCEMTKPATSGVRQRFPSETPRGFMSRVMVGAIAASSIRRTASPPIFFSTCPSKDRSRSRAFG